MITISWGPFTEKDTEQKWGKEYIPRTELELNKLCMLGISIVYVSGDDGAEHNISPDYPSTSARVLTVAGTMTEGQVPIDNEVDYSGQTASQLCRAFNASCLVSGYQKVACEENGADWSCGGGFSNVLKTPSWQSQFVADYLALNKTEGNLPRKGSFNPNGKVNMQVE